MRDDRTSTTRHTPLTQWQNLLRAGNGGAQIRQSSVHCWLQPVAKCRLQETTLRPSAAGWKLTIRSVRNVIYSLETGCWQFIAAPIAPILEGRPQGPLHFE